MARLKFPAKNSALGTPIANDPTNFAKSMPWWSYATYTQNFWMAVRGNFGGAGMSVTWSLAVEEQFYLTLPLVIRLARSGLKYVLLAGLLAAPILRIPLGSGGDPTDWLGFVILTGGTAWLALRHPEPWSLQMETLGYTWLALCRIASRKLLPDGYRCLTGNVTDERVCHHVAFTTWEAPWIPR